MKAAAVVVVSALGLAQVAQLPKFTSSTSLVRLDVGVADDRGPVRGLRAKNFVVTDNGVRQTVGVEEFADAPLDVVLVAPPIPSFAYTSPEQAARIAPALSAVLTEVEERDRLGVILADAPPTRLRALESGRPSFDASAFSRGTFAAPYDAMTAALGEFDQSDRRRVLMAFTNGTDFRSTVSFDALADLSSRLGPALVLVGAPVKIREQVHVAAETREGRPITESVAAVSGSATPLIFERLARRTGGVAVDLGRGDPARLIADVFVWLRTTYVISYEPPAGAGWHPVSVKVNRRDANVTAREGYFNGAVKH